MKLPQAQRPPSAKVIEVQAIAAVQHSHVRESLAVLRSAMDRGGSGFVASICKLWSSQKSDVEDNRRLRIAGRRSEKHHLIPAANDSSFQALVQGNRNARGGDVAVVGYVAMESILGHIDPASHHFERPGRTLMRNDVKLRDIDMRAIGDFAKHRRQVAVRSAHQGLAVHVEPVARVIAGRVIEDGMKMAAAVDDARLADGRSASLA